MRYRYYMLDADGFWADVCNPRWTEKQTRGWGLRFYEWTRDPHQRAQHLQYLQDYNDWHEALLEGTYLKVTNPRESSEVLADAGILFNTIHHVQVISPRAYKVLRSLRLDDEVEFEAYPLHDKDGNLVDTYYCVRYLVHLDCADERRSFVEREPFPWCRWRLVLQRPLIGAHRMFLVTNFVPRREVVRSDVVEAIERAGLTGFYFDVFEEKGSELVFEFDWRRR